MPTLLSHLLVLIDDAGGSALGPFGLDWLTEDVIKAIGLFVVPVLGIALKWLIDQRNSAVTEIKELANQLRDDLAAERTERIRISKVADQLRDDLAAEKAARLQWESELRTERSERERLRRELDRVCAQEARSQEIISRLRTEVEQINGRLIDLLRRVGDCEERRDQPERRQTDLGPPDGVERRRSSERRIIRDDGVQD